MYSCRVFELDPTMIQGGGVSQDSCEVVQCVSHLSHVGRVSCVRAKSAIFCSLQLWDSKEKVLSGPTEVIL